MAKKLTAKKKKNPHRGTTLESFLAEEGILEETQTLAIKEVLAWQLLEAMRTRKLSRNRLAQEMGTSRSQIGRLLDPTDGNVTLATLQRAATAIGRKVRVELI